MYRAIHPVTGQYGRDPFNVHVWWFLGTRGVAKGPGLPPWALCFLRGLFPTNQNRVRITPMIVHPATAFTLSIHRSENFRIPKA
jgi:hypothetical protein